MNTTRSKLEIAAVSLTQRCNLACSHCADTASGTRPDRTSREIGRPLLRSLFSQFRELGVRQVILSGGEPLLRKDLFEIIGDAGDAGLSCALLTNGTLLTPARLKRLKATGVVDYLRLSVEFPEGDVAEAVRSHDAVQTFRTVRAATDAGLVAGVNMTLLPGNLRYAAKLAEASVSAGAAFFRAVPVLPAGRSASAVLPHSFLANCIATLLPLHAAYRTGVRKEFRHDSQYAPSPPTPFITPCSGGGRMLTVTADGKAHICAMADLEGKAVDVSGHSVAECLRKLSRRRVYLQKKNVASPGGNCHDCRDVAECRGGCLSERAVRTSSAGQPCCIRKSWEDVLAGCHSPRLKNVALDIVGEFREYLLFNRPAPCVRALPFWVVYFGE